MIRQKPLKINRPRSVHRTHKSPTLRLSPTAWAKLLYLRDVGETEVGGFGISPADDLLLVEDVQLVQQDCTGVSVALDDLAVADFFDRQVDLGRRPEQFARIWVHTHPGNCPEPSLTDEATFARVFGRTDWALMFVLARQGQTYARLRFHVGPGGDLRLPVRVDYSRSFSASDYAAWKAEYHQAVRVASPPLATFGLAPLAGPLEPWEEDDWDPFGQGLFEGKPVTNLLRETHHAF